MNSSSSHHADVVLASLGAPLRVPETIAASWRRCVLDHHLDPGGSMPPAVLTGFELRCARGELGRLLRVADAELDRLHRLVNPLGYSVLMTDAEGVVVARRVAERDEPSCRHWRLWTGALWSEAVEGTNGVGTCLAEGRPITVHRDQHFRDRHARLTCTVAPLFDAGGALAGAIDISSSRPDADRAVLPLAMAAVEEAAHRIETACFHDAFGRATLLALPPATRSEAEISVPILAIDEERRIVGATRAARHRGAGSRRRRHRAGHKAGRPRGRAGRARGGGAHCHRRRARADARQRDRGRAPPRDQPRDAPPQGARARSRPGAALPLGRHAASGLPLEPDT